MAEKKTTTKKAAPKKQDYNGMKKAELEKAIVELRTDIAVIKKSTLVGDAQNVRAHANKRKELARALTALNGLKDEETK
jgi:ribosomal protein L29